MKVSIIQPYYSLNYKDRDYCYNEMIKYLDSLDESSDIIVLPEYSDIPVSTPSKKEFDECIDLYRNDILERAKRASIRCNAIVFVNCAEITADNKFINTTHAINRKGEVVFKYFKAHPAPSEYKYENDTTVKYPYDSSYIGKKEMQICEIDGIRFGFLTCYDFYFYEDLINLARCNLDAIIGCSHQRSDTHSALEIINRNVSYQTNAFLLRSSVSLGEDSKICGCSSVIKPNGDVLLDMKSRIGVESVDIDIKEKYLKPSGFKGALGPHYQYVDIGRDYILDKKNNK